MRAFIAISLNDAVHKELAALIDILRGSACDVKWVEPSNIHLTIKFLGEIDEGTLKNIKALLAESVQLHKPFYIHIGGVGAFPKISYPRVLWVGIDEGKIESEALQKSVEDRLRALGFPSEDRPFSAHCTLARVRSPKNKERLIKLLEKQKFFSSQNKVLVDKITLFQSTLTPNGSIYTPIENFGLAQA